MAKIEDRIRELALRTTGDRLLVFTRAELTGAIGDVIADAGPDTVVAMCGVIAAVRRWRDEPEGSHAEAEAERAMWQALDALDALGGTDG